MIYVGSELLINYRRILFMDYNDAISSLIEGTNFEISSESEVLTSCKLKVRTPIEVLNCLLGGGLPLSGIYHTWGPPKGGKSTWLYQTMGIFQQQYPDGICVIIDMESSADPVRLRAFGIDTDKVMRLPATSIESGFLALLKIISNKQKNDKIRDIPLFVIWDTISRGMAQDSSTQSRMNAQDRARIIKNYMPQLSSEIEKQPFILGLINQVINTSDTYGNKKQTSGGGVALQHDNHLSLKIDFKSENLDSTKSFVISKWSNMTVDKSKISPEIKNIPFLIDVTRGGVIVERESFIWYLVDNMQIITQAGGWYNIDSLYKKYEGTKIGDYIYSFCKKYRYNDLINTLGSDETMYNILKLAFMDYISSVFSLQSSVIKPYMDQIYNEVVEVTGVDNPESDSPVEAVSDTDSTTGEEGNTGDTNE